jgi:hypothetical protein
MRDRRHRRRPLPGRVLPHPDLEVVAFELELAQLVLADHVEKLLDLVEIHLIQHDTSTRRTPSPTASSCCCLVGAFVVT